MTFRALRQTLPLLLLFLLGSFFSGCAQTPQAQQKQYMFWPPTPAVPHIQFLTSINSSADVTGQQGKLETLIYGQDTTGNLPLQRPFGVRMYQGQIFIADATAGNVTILDLRKKEVRILGKAGQTNLLKPIDIAVAPDGIKYVADTGTGAIMVFDATDHYAGKVAVKGMHPVSVAVHDRELYVSDMIANLVRVFDRFNGKEIRTIGEPLAAAPATLPAASSAATEPAGRLGGAMGLSVDDQGNVYVNDFIGCRVQKFSPDGKLLYSIGGLGRLPGNFVRPKHMAVDSTGILYVVDNAFQNVQMFNPQGKTLMFFGAPGRHPGAMSLPAGICVSDTDLDLFQQYVHPAFQMQRLIIVTNNLGSPKVNIYALGELKPGKTVADISAGRGQLIGAFEQASTLNGGPELGLPPDAPTTEPAASPTTQPSVPSLKENNLP